MTKDPSDTKTFKRPDPTLGTPIEDGGAFPGQQSYPDTCAIRCQEFIIEQFTGHEVNEDGLIQEAIAHGWYTPGGGTATEDVGNLLELHGILVNRYQEANIFHLAKELSQGHKVIIGVDSGELWSQHPVLEQIEDALGIEGADHAVVVSGIDTTDPHEIRIIVSDPGSGEPVATYPMAQFLDAWQDSHFTMVSTCEAAPSYLPEMLNFAYLEGHIPQIAGMPYEEFMSYANVPETWADKFESAFEVVFEHFGNLSNILLSGTLSNLFHVAAELEAAEAEARHAAEGSNAHPEAEFHLVNPDDPEELHAAQGNIPVGDHQSGEGGGAWGGDPGSSEDNLTLDEPYTDDRDLIY